MDEDDSVSADGSAPAPAPGRGSDSDPDPNRDPDTARIQWRRDASTSRTVRLLWSLGVGTFFAMIAIVVLWRFYDMAAQVGVGTVVGALLAALLVTLVALALADTEVHLEAIARWLPIETPSERALERTADALYGTLAMMAVVGSLMGVGRIASQQDWLGLGAGPFTGAAALMLPLALVALALSSFLRSVGALDREERTIYLYDPDQAIDLELIRGVSTRRLGDAAILTLDYAQPDGQYVAGPRRVVVPPEVARELQSLVERQAAA